MAASAEMMKWHSFSSPGQPLSAETESLQLTLHMLAPVCSLRQLMFVNGLIVLKDKELRNYECVDTSVPILMVCVFNGLFIIKWFVYFTDDICPHLNLTKHKLDSYLLLFGFSPSLLSFIFYCP